MTSKKILFFADRLPPLTGGVEIHGGEFIRYFKNHSSFSIERVITKETEGIPYDLAPKILFFNSGRWIEKLKKLRKRFPKALFIYRTGGNETIKAALVHNFFPSHKIRQNYWAKTLNQTLDLLITNSAFTEKRLMDMGIKVPFVRCVGGASLYDTSLTKLKRDKPIFFSATRFVPYKNPLLLIRTFKKLKEKGLSFSLRMAGSGPLFEKSKQEAKKIPDIELLGKINNQQVAKEMAQADLYIQLSSDHKVAVPGGSYMHTEGMGRSILEAIASGTYVIAGNCGALSEIVTKERGRLISLNSLETITQDIERILEKLPISLQPTEEYSWNHLFKQYEVLYESISHH